MRILPINLVCNTLLFLLVAKIYVLPKLSIWKPKTVLVPILLLHSTRHLGLMFLSPGATSSGIPAEFANPAAYGDLVAALLAIVSVFALLKNLPAAWAIVWIFNLEGTLDLFTAIALATTSEAEAYMGPSYWIPALWVPALLVTHYIVFVILLKHRARAATP